MTEEMGFPWKGWRYGPIFLPGIYDEKENIPLLRVFLIIFGLCFYRFCSFAKPRMFYAKRRLTGKVAIVTGCNSGIGKETVKEMARLGCRVIMACRNIEKAHEARDEIIEYSKNKNIFVYKLDLSSFKSIRQFTKDFLAAEDRLDILIHNAGYGNVFKKGVSEDGIEITMATNHYGPFLLTHLLMPVLRKTEKARIIVVASDLYRFSKVNLKELNPLNSFPMFLYYASKNANIMFTLELAKKLEGTGITANCLHPGMVDSDIWRHTPYPFTYFVNFLRKKFFKTALVGAQQTLSLAIDEEFDNVSGKYFMEMRPEKLREQVTNEKRNSILWKESVKMVKLTENDPQI